MYGAPDDLTRPGREADALDRFWDDHRSGQAIVAPRPANLGLDRVATVELIHELAAFPETASARSRVRQRLFAGRAGSSAVGPLLSPPADHPASRPATVRDAGGRRRRPLGRFWPPLEFAAACLALLLLFAGVLAVRPGGIDLGSALRDDDPAGTEAEPAISRVMRLRLFRTGSPSAVTLRRLTFPPGAHWGFGNDAFGADSDWMDHLVEEGVLTARSYGGTGFEEQDVPAGKGVVAHVGLRELRNDGDVPAVVLQLVSHPADREPIAPPSDVAVDLLGVAPIAATGSWGDEQVQVSVHRVTLPAGESLGGLGDDRPILVAVESGSLAVEAANGEIRLGTGESAAFPLSDIAPTIAATDAPAVAFVMTRDRLDRNRPITSLVARLDLPPDSAPIGLALRRVTLEPGGSFEFVSGEVSLVWVEEGAVVDQFGADGRPRALQAAEWAVAENRVLALRNEGPGTAILVLGSVFASGRTGISESSAGEVNSVLIGEAVVAGVPAGPASVSLSRGDLGASSVRDASGAGHGMNRSPAATLIAVERGALDLWVKSGNAEVRRQIEGRLGPVLGPATPETFEPGRRVRLEAGDMVAMRPGSSYEVQQVGLDDARIVVFSLAPESSGGDDEATARATPDTLGLGEFAMLGPEECRVEPRTVEELRALVRDAGTVDPLALSLRDEVATGRPADPTTTAAIVATAREIAACLAAGDDLRLYALVSDDAIRALAATGVLTEMDVDGIARGEGRQPREQASVVVSDVRIFPDGRAGAVVLLDGELAYMTFVKVGDRWRMDAFDDREGLATPAP